MVAPCPDLIRVLEPPDDMVEDAFLVMHRRSRDHAHVELVANAIVSLFRTKRDMLAGLRPL